MMKKNITFHIVSAAVWGCFPIISKADKDSYVKPFRQYKDLSDKIELTVDGQKYVYWTTVPAMFLCYLSDLFDFKAECLDFLAMGVTKHEGFSEYQRYVDHFGKLLETAVDKQPQELNEGERMFLRKYRLIKTKLKQAKDVETMFKYN